MKAMSAEVYDLGLTLREAGALEPGEFMGLIEAGKRRESREWDRVAWLAAHILNLYRSKNKAPIKVEDLLGRPLTDAKKRRGKKRTKAEAERERRYLLGLD